MRNRELGSYLLFVGCFSSLLLFPAFPFFFTYSFLSPLPFSFPFSFLSFSSCTAPCHPQALLRASPQDVACMSRPHGPASSPVSLGTAPSWGSSPLSSTFYISFHSLLLGLVQSALPPFTPLLAASLLTPPQYLSLSNHLSPTFSCPPVNTGYSLCFENSRTSLG